MQPESEEILTPDKNSNQNYSIQNDIFKSVSIIASHLINMNPERFDQVIINSIRILSKVICCERGYVCKIIQNQNQYKLKCIGCWLRDETGNDEISALNSWVKKIIGQNKILLININNFKNDLKGDYKYYRCNNSSSAIIVPLIKNGKTYGILGFDKILNIADIDRFALKSLRFASVMFVNAIEYFYSKNGSTIDIPKNIDYAYLKHENEKLRELNLLKSEFVSMVSHEIRTPLTGIIGLTQALRLPDLVLTEREKDRYLSIIESEGKRLAVLIRDLLDFSMIESGNIKLIYSEFNIDQLISEVTTLMNCQDTTKYKVSFGHEGPVSIFADRDRIKQVLIILFDNARKHGGKNSSTEIDIDKTGRIITISVSDQGPGISSEEQEKIFNKFYSIKSFKRKKKGSGLGLAIAKKIIEAHGGKIWVESEIGYGCTFKFSLNAANDKIEEDGANERSASLYP